MLLKVQVFCNVKLRRSDSNYRRFELLLCHHLQSPAIERESDTRIKHSHITHIFSSAVGLLELHDEGTMIVRNVENYSLNDTPFHAIL